MKALLVGLVFVVVASVGLGALARTSAGDFLVPDPESVVQKLVKQMESGRYEPALEALDKALAQQEGMEGLEKLDKGLKAKYGDYEFELGGTQDQTGDTATYRARIKFGENSPEEVPFTLEHKQATGLWKVTSLAGLEQRAAKQ